MHSSIVCVAFVSSLATQIQAFLLVKNKKITPPFSILFNAYDDFRSDGCPALEFLSEENVQAVLNEYVDSDFGQQMFGKHPMPSRVGVTGELSFVSLEGPEVTLALKGAFWHKRSTVLGRAAMWLNARIPEIVEVRVAEPSELDDVEVVTDEVCVPDALSVLSIQAL
jgi:hypothetical protein